MASFEIDNNKTYSFPPNLSIHYISDKILIIAPETARWIVLQNNAQLDIFRQLSLKSIADLVSCGIYSELDIMNTVLQVEAKHFCSVNRFCSPNCTKELHFYITNQCNLRCPLCYMSSGKQNDNELSTQEINFVLKKFASIGGLSVTFSGGEPSVRADFFKILTQAKELSLETRVITNGVLWDKEYCKQIHNLVSTVQVSIDGFSPSSDSVIRGKEHFNKAIDAVSYLLDLGVEVQIAITPTIQMLQNYKDKYVNHCRTLIKKWDKYPFSIRFSEGLLNGRGVTLKQTDLDLYKSIVCEIKKEINGKDYEFEDFLESMLYGNTYNNCALGNIVISSTGDVYFCPNINAFKSHLNIRDNSMCEILDASNKIIDYASIKNRKYCSECDIKNICGGLCILESCPSVAEDWNYFSAKGFKTIGICPSGYKDQLYDFMIRSNESLYEKPEGSTSIG